MCEVIDKKSSRADNCEGLLEDKQSAIKVQTKIVRYVACLMDYSYLQE